MLRGLASLICVLAVTSAAAEPSEPVPDTAAERPASPLPFHYDLYTFRGDAGRTAVVAAFAVPVGRLEEERERWAALYRFDVSLELADTARKSVTRTDDSVVVRMPRSMTSDHLLHTHVEVQAPPSPTTVQRVIMTDASAPGIGQLYTTPFPIRDYHGSELVLSDVALGLPDAKTGWERGDVTLALLPTSLFPGNAFDVYYEIYNLPRGRPYETEITIDRIAGPEGEPIVREREVTLRLSGESSADDDDVLPELRHVETALANGGYRLTVTVTDESTGRSASRSRVFDVRDWGPGATLVPALPRRSWASSTHGPDSAVR